MWFIYFLLMLVAGFVFMYTLIVFCSCITPMPCCPKCDRSFDFCERFCSHCGSLLQ